MNLTAVLLLNADAALNDNKSVWILIPKHAVELADPRAKLDDDGAQRS